MANTKAVGVAYADPEFESVSVTGNATVAGTMTVGGNTLSGTELGYVDGITPGTVAVNKAIVPTTNKHIDALVISDGGLALGSGAGTAITATGAEINVLAGVTAGTTAPSKALVLDAAESLVWATTDATASETVTLSIQDTRTGAGAVGWAQKLELVSNVALGSYANAGYNLVTFGASGAVVGLAAGVCGEVELSAGTTAGTYASLEAELTANSACSTGTDTAFLYANIAGSNSTGKTTVNTNAHMFMLGTGVVDTTDGLFDVLAAPQAVTSSARLRIKVGSTLYYLPVCASAALTS